MVVADSAAGCGYNTISFFGTIFEGNMGDYDFEASNTHCPGALVTFVGASFLRVSATDYPTNSIVMAGSSVGQTLNLAGTTFIYEAGYTPNAGRPNVSLSNTNSMVVDNGSNYFQNRGRGAAVSCRTERLPGSIARRVDGIHANGVVRQRNHNHDDCRRPIQVSQPKDRRVANEHQYLVARYVCYINQRDDAIRGYS